MTLLMAFCDYLGNSVKVTIDLSYNRWELLIFDSFSCWHSGSLWIQDAVSAPRPSSPPVRRVTATEDEKENAMEYGLPSSHALNTVCLMGYARVPILLLRIVFWCIIPFVSMWEALKSSFVNGPSGWCRYLLHYVLTYGSHDNVMVVTGLSLAFLLVMLVGIGESPNFSMQHS